MGNCVMCGSPIPDNQGSNTCSMCYGDPGHGKDGYYQEWLDEQERQATEEDAENERQNGADGSQYDLDKD
jgi:hypothetical protein